MSDKHPTSNIGTDPVTPDKYDETLEASFPD